MDQTIEDFIQAVRGAEVRVSVAETLEAFDAVKLIGYEHRQMLKDTLSFICAKTKEDKERFDDAFEKFFVFRSFIDSDQQPKEAEESSTSEEENIDRELSSDETDMLVQMLLEGDKVGLATAMRQASREVGITDIWFFTQRGVYTQKIMRQMGLQSLTDQIVAAETGDAPCPARAKRLREAKAYLFEQVKDFVEQQLALFSTAATNQLREEILKENKLSNIEEKDFKRMHNIVQNMAKRLVNVHSARQKRAQRGVLDFRRTIRNNMAYDGNLFETHWQMKKIDRPRVVAICDCSKSVEQYSRFLLLFLYSMNEVISRIRTFAFCSDVIEVSNIFDNNSVEESMLKVQQTVPPGRTDYGQTFRTLKKDYLSAFTPKTTVLILGDARNNLMEPEAGILKLIQQRSRHVIWLNPEGEHLWGFGDSEMELYRPFCHIATECNTVSKLDRMVDSMLKLSMRSA